MYPSTYKNNFPTGRGFHWKMTNDGKFQKTLMTNSNISVGSVEWITAMRSYSLFVNKKGERCKILYGWNTQEVLVGPYEVDGYVEVDEKKYVLEYDGCYFHDTCPKCGLKGRKRVRSFKKKSGIPKTIFKENAQERAKFMEDNGFQTIRIHECEFNKHKTALKRDISILQYESKICQEKLIDAIVKHDAYGFLLCDIEPHSEESNKFIELNWPPIIHNDDVLFDDLSPEMQKISSHIRFPRRTLVQTMHATKILLHTELVKFYVSNGFKISKAYDFYEFEASPCFDRLYTKLYESRVEATEQNDDTKATAIKLVGNSTYGQSIMVGIPN